MKKTISANVQKKRPIFWMMFLVIMLLCHVTNAYSLTSCVSDFDGDRDVDGSDLAVFAADFGKTVLAVAVATSMVTAM